MKANKACECIPLIVLLCVDDAIQMCKHIKENFDFSMSHEMISESFKEIK
jgi:hypothetical protein